MKSFLQGFLSIFDFGAAFMPPRSRKMEKLLQDMEKRSNWYHRGEWWDHPLYRDTWKEKE